MKRILYLIVLFTVAFASAHAQEILFKTGMSFHSLSELKSFQNSLNNEFYAPMKSTQSFPAYLQFGMTYRSSLRNKIRFGGTAYTTSSAARSTYSDYSGTQQLDYELKCIGFSLYANYLIGEFTNSTLSLYGHGGLLLNMLKTDFSVQLANGVDHEVESWKSVNEVVEFGLEYKYLFSPKFFIELQSGLHLNIASEMESDGNGNSVPPADWRGIKLMICVGYSFQK